MRDDMDSRKSTVMPKANNLSESSLMQHITGSDDLEDALICLNGIAHLLHHSNLREMPDAACEGYDFVMSILCTGLNEVYAGLPAKEGRS